MTNPEPTESNSKGCTRGAMSTTRRIWSTSPDMRPLECNAQDLFPIPEPLVHLIETREMIYSL